MKLCRTFLGSYLSLVSTELQQLQSELCVSESGLCLDQHTVKTVCMRMVLSYPSILSSLRFSSVAGYNQARYMLTLHITQS